MSSRCNFPTKKTGIPCKKYCVRGMNRCQSHLYQREGKETVIPREIITLGTLGRTPIPRRRVNIEICEEDYTFHCDGEEVKFTCRKDLFQKILLSLAKEEEELLPSLFRGLGIK